MKLTLFDLDHTLLPIDSDYAWGLFTTTIGWTDPVEFAQRNEAFYAQSPLTRTQPLLATGWAGQRSPASDAPGL